MSFDDLLQQATVEETIEEEEGDDVTSGGQLGDSEDDEGALGGFGRTIVAAGAGINLLDIVQAFGDLAALSRSAATADGAVSAASKRESKGGDDDVEEDDEEAADDGQSGRVTEEEMPLTAGVV